MQESNGVEGYINCMCQILTEGLEENKSHWNRQPEEGEAAAAAPCPQVQPVPKMKMYSQ